MKELLRKTYVDVLSRMDRYPTAMTQKRALEQLIGSLHPVNPGMELLRFGPDSDGGYLIPDDLAGIEACFSPGVSTVSGFEKDCADRGIKVFLADKSVDMPPDKHELFAFTKKFIGASDTADFMTVDSWVRDSGCGAETDLILQMDIEGFEYESLLNLSDDTLKRFRIVLVEFHGLGDLWSVPFFKIASAVFKKLLNHHACVHIHPNNIGRLVSLNGIDIPNGAEFTFLRRDRIQGKGFATKFPHPLDRDNVSHCPPQPLPSSWYQSGNGGLG